MSALRCPQCGNNRFSVTAHVTETWLVNETGDFIEVLPGYGEQVVSRPDLNGGFLFACRECGMEAEVVP
jgi:hypothetical protein